MSESINIHEAIAYGNPPCFARRQSPDCLDCAQLSKLLSRVALGEEFTIANRGVPVAKLIPYTHSETRENRQPGRLTGQIIIGDDFDEADKKITQLFEGNE